VLEHRKAVCPRCAGSVERVRRRLIDRIVSVFVPVRRYRCRNDACSWEGNLRSAGRSATGYSSR
jgi:hypothetical protein